MATSITIDTEQVQSIATQIETDNGQLQELLNESKATLDNLQSTWTGNAAENTRTSYNQFATKYFQTYYDVLNQYVQFLRNNVAQQYETTENRNTTLGEAFK